MVWSPMECAEHSQENRLRPNSLPKGGCHLIVASVFFCILNKEEKDVDIYTETV